MLEEDDNDDSLDLLLDTLCNAFGGIILITLLIALMSKEAHEAETAPESFRTQALVEEQRIAQLDDQLAIEQGVAAAMPEPNNASGSTASLAQEKNELENAKDEAVAVIESLRRRLAEVPANAENLALELERRKRELDERTQALASGNAAMEKEIEQKQGTVSKTRSELSKFKKERTERLRLPKEKRDTRKAYLWTVVRYGKIYPIAKLNDHELERFFDVKQVITLQGKGFRFTPKMRSGLNPSYDGNALASYIRKVNPSSEYLAFEVFPDDNSFKAFNEAKKLATSRGIGYTWEPKDTDLVLGSNGTGARPEQ